MGGVADADVDGVLARAVKSPLLQPYRQPGAAPGGVDDEIGVHRFTGIELHAGHPLPGGVESRLADRGVHYVDVGDRVDRGAGSAIPGAAGSARMR